MSSPSAPKELGANKVHGGYVRKYSHPSSSTSSDMKFNVFLPPQASNDNRLPVLYWLSGLTCTEDNFMQKAAPFKAAVQHGLVIVAPDTSPRGLGLPGEKESWDFGEGASFYLNATNEPWSKHYRMHDYLTNELPALIEAHFPVTSVKSISGHSMGGHGALITYLRSPAGAYQHVSAFSPIAHPSDCPWGVKAFTGYLGADRSHWADWDATALIKHSQASKVNVLVDVGGADEYYIKKQLLPEDLVAAGKQAGWQVELRVHEGYDHSYYFVQSFLDEHIARHVAALKAKTA